MNNFKFKIRVKEGIIFMEVKVHGFENLTIQHVQRAFEVLGKLQSDKYGVEISYTVKKAEK